MELPSTIEKHPSPDCHYSPRPFDAVGGDCTRRAKSCNPTAQLFPLAASAPLAPPPARAHRVRFLNEIQVFEYEQADYAAVEDDADDVVPPPNDWSSLATSSSEDDDDDEYDPLDAAEADQGILVVFAPSDRPFIPCLPNRRQKY